MPMMLRPWRFSSSCSIRRISAAISAGFRFTPVFGTPPAAVLLPDMVDAPVRRRRTSRRQRVSHTKSKPRQTR